MVIKMKVPSFHPSKDARGRRSEILAIETSITTRANNTKTSGMV